MKKTTIGAVIAGISTAAVLGIGGVSLADTLSSSATTSSTASSGAATTPSTTTPPAGGQGASQDATVTGDEAAKVSAAVTAKDSSVTVTGVRKDPDGSYDVLGTKSGQPVMFDVSADLATVTANAGPGGQGGQGGHGGPGQRPAPANGSPAAPSTSSSSTATS